MFSLCLKSSKKKWCFFYLPITNETALAAYFEKTLRQDEKTLRQDEVSDFDCYHLDFDFLLLCKYCISYIYLFSY